MREWVLQARGRGWIHAGREGVGGVRESTFSFKYPVAIRPTENDSYQNEKKKKIKVIYTSWSILRNRNILFMTDIWTIRVRINIFWFHFLFCGEGKKTATPWPYAFVFILSFVLIRGPMLLNQRPMPAERKDMETNFLFSFISAACSSRSPLMINGDSL